jgi:hypothetical protein
MLCDWQMFSIADLFLAAGKLVAGVFRGVFEAGYWRIF